ncbi:MAG: hypothetical protein EAZ46_09725 [Runella sp.]|nr:MAG: hypothetical protein EAZ46_09725 [Runella sp.]
MTRIFKSQRRIVRIYFFLFIRENPRYSVFIIYLLRNFQFFARRYLKNQPITAKFFFVPPTIG